MKYSTDVFVKTENRNICQRMDIFFTRRAHYTPTSSEALAVDAFGMKDCLVMAGQWRTTAEMITLKHFRTTSQTLKYTICALMNLSVCKE